MGYRFLKEEVLWIASLKDGIMVRKRSYEVIELFDEKTGDVVRLLRFRNSIAFDEFLKDFKAMRYPGYDWRDIDKGKKKEKHE